MRKRTSSQYVVLESGKEVKIQGGIAAPVKCRFHIGIVRSCGPAVVHGGISAGELERDAMTSVVEVEDCNLKHTR